MHSRLTTSYALHTITFYVYTHRLVHPLSPRGKLVHWGREGLDATNRLIAEACQSLAAGAADESASSSRIVLRDELYRLAITDQHVQQLQTTAVNLPDYCEWKTADELLKGKIVDETANVLGALRLFNGCRVIHVPSYLQGLWIACRERGAVWKIVDADTSSRSSMAAWKDRLQDFDVVVLAAGSGLFDSSSSGRSSLLLSKQTELPVQLVRGQSVEIRSPQQRAPSAALLCGKYVSPTPDPNVTLVGATHEFQAHAATPDTVVTELQERTADFSPELWKTGQVERRTVGYRVQSERGMNGRMPIIGQLQSSSSTTTAASKLEGDLQEVHPNMWVFTGLSSRGLLFHGLYGDILTDAILQNSEEPMLSRCRDLDWWRRRPKKKPTNAREQPL